MSARGVDGRSDRIDRQGVMALRADDTIDPAAPTEARTYPYVRELLRQNAALPRQSFLSRLLGLHPLPATLRPLYRAAVGEVAVGDALGQLGDEWLILHAVPVGREGADVDHIAVGPPGVFTVAVRHHHGQALWVGEGVLLVDGERMPHIRDCAFEAVRAAQLMSDAVGERVEVTPCLVVVGARSVTVTRPPRRVAILTPRDLRPWLRSLPVTYSPDQLARFRTAASEADTWHDARSPTADLVESLERYRALQSRVHQSRHLRLTWITGGLVLAWMVVIIAIGGFTTGLLLD